MGVIWLRFFILWHRFGILEHKRGAVQINTAPLSLPRGFSYAAAVHFVPKWVPKWAHILRKFGVLPSILANISHHAVVLASV